MSRFFTAGDSSSESSSEDEEELYSGDEGAAAKVAEEESSEEEASDEEAEDSSSSDEGGKSGPSKFLRDAASSDESDDDEKTTVVRSAKDKRMEELDAVVNTIDNKLKVGDWGRVSEGKIARLVYAEVKLTRISHAEFDKLNRQVLKMTTSEKPPKAYVKTISDLEDFMNEAIAKQKVSTKKMNATNARGLNAMKQKLKKNNKDYTKEIEEYRADKFEYMMSDEEEETAPVEKPKKSRSATYADPMDAGDDEGFSTVGKGGKTLQYTPESILKHLRSIVESRGKKNTDRAEQIRIMERLLEVADTPYRTIRVLLTLIATRFDLTTGSTSTHMSQENWKSADHELTSLLEKLEENRNMVVVENAEEWEDDDKPPTPAAEETLKIPGSVVSVVERLDDELTRSLQHIDPHTAEYIERLTDEQALYNNILRALIYVENLKKDTKLELSDDGTNRLIMRRLEHVYFKVSAAKTLLVHCVILTFPLSQHKSSILWKKRLGNPYRRLLTP